jgi:hypothetical protein
VHAMKLPRLMNKMAGNERKEVRILKRTEGNTQEAINDMFLIGCSCLLAKTAA